MASLNSCDFMGNLTRDPQVRKTAAGKSVCDFGIAINDNYTDAAGNRQEQTDFHEIVAWGALADLCEKYLRKGSCIFVNCRAKNERWEDKGTGEKRTKTRFVASNIQFLDSKKKDDERPQTRSSMRNPEPEVEDENW
jgi:single-strand DNA-binding protein